MIYNMQNYPCCHINVQMCSSYKLVFLFENELSFNIENYFRFEGKISFGN